MFDLSGDTAEDILPLTIFIRGLCRAEKYSEVEKFMQELPVEKCSILVIITVLRSTYAYSKHIENYFCTLNRCKQEIDNRGRDGGSLLRGLWASYDNSFSCLFPGLLDNEHKPKSLTKTV